MSVIVTGPRCVVEVVVLLGVVVEALDGNRMVEIEKDRTGRASFLKAAHVVLVQSPGIVLAQALVFCTWNSRGYHVRLASSSQECPGVVVRFMLAVWVRADMLS